MQRFFSGASQNRDPAFFGSYASWAPALQRTASQGLRAALRPGHVKHYAMNMRAADASVSRPPKAMKILPISEVWPQVESSLLIAAGA